ncbi:SGNH/GDSL hydrolase family protein [Ruminococcus sp. NK3A76]|uniref:SGNH/GDSL hydrolase family protein n=1 Tax=Ruminococcus sp. NK3A76 TaxID=877411 RepID=UPI00068CBCB5|nr:SGNH/GDSL hydrolase family protein [Ruminococcus sp. NK3A76]
MAEQKATSPPIRAKNQQNIISLFCVCTAVAVFIWLILTGLSIGKKMPADDDSSVVAVDKNDSEVSKEKDSDPDSSPDSDSEDDGSSDTDTEHGPSDFSDACFIGDSRTVGLSYNSGKPMATFYCATGLNVSSALDEPNIELENGNLGNVVDALGQRQFDRIYIMFGINEVGWPYVDQFQSEYEELINAVKAAQPDAKIYVQLIIPVTASRSAQGDSINNTNVATFNEAVKAAATNCGVEWIDVSPALVDASGCLPEDAATDGVHMTKDYLVKWIEYLEQNT